MTTTKAPTLLLSGIVGLVTLLCVAVGALGILDELSQDTRTTVRDLGAVRSIDLVADDGDVEIRATDRRQATLKVIEETGLFGGPDVNVSTAGGQVRLDSDCMALVFGNSCSVKWILNVPRGTTIRSRSDAGDVALTGVDGALGIDTGSGDIVARDVRSPRVRLHTGAGDVDLRLASAPRAVRTETGSGDVRVLAPGGPYAVTVETGSGDQDVDVPTDPGSSRTMRAQTGSGDVEILRP